MTTIACTMKTMVGDRKLVQGDQYTLITKIFEIRGEIVGAAGNYEDTESFLEWYQQKNRKSKPKIKEANSVSFEGLVLNKDGIWWYDSSLHPTKMERDPFYAIGTSAVAAMCLMRKGLTPKEAIEHVSMYDNSTSVETDTLELKLG